MVHSFHIRHRFRQIAGVSLIVITGLVGLGGCSPLDVLAILNGCKDVSAVSGAQAPSSVVAAANTADNPQIEKWVSWAEQIAADSSHGYSQARRNSQIDYDCSSLVFFALKHGGISLGNGWPFVTSTMGNILKAHGFTEFRWNGSDTSSLKRGDIVVHPPLSDGHTEFYAGNGIFVGARHASPRGIEDGMPGDQSNEIHESALGTTNLTWAYRMGEGGSGGPANMNAQTTQTGSAQNAGFSCNTETSTVAASSTMGARDGVHATPSQAQKIAKEMMSEYGFTETSEYECLVWLWNHESGWRWDADNPTSDAYGIPQSLPGSKMATAGSDWKDNAATQIKWGLQYIKGRYQTPCGAKQYWLSHNWY